MGLVKRWDDRQARLRLAEELRKKEVERQADFQERHDISEAFNHRYVFKHPYPGAVEASIPEKTAQVVCGRRGDGARRWMCHTCNKIHAPTHYSLLVGLCYPACCGNQAGARIRNNW